MKDSHTHVHVKDRHTRTCEEQHTCVHVEDSHTMCNITVQITGTHVCTHKGRHTRVCTQRTGTHTCTHCLGRFPVRLQPWLIVREPIWTAQS